MTPSTPQGEIRPVRTVRDDEYPVVPLLRLRRRHRDVIPPERCLLGPDCLVCQWRRDGLLDGPIKRAA